MSKSKYKVLLVDDSPDDRFFIRTVLERTSRFVIVSEARDGQEAMDYLQEETQDNEEVHPSPDVLLLDLKMPGKNGFDVLKWIQGRRLKNLTKVVMSGSWLAEDIAKSLELGADGYFKKTSVRSEQEAMIREIEKLLHKNGGQ